MQFSLCCDKCAARSYCARAVLPCRIRRYTLCVRLCNSDATAALEEIRQGNLNGEFPTDTCSIVVNSTGEKGSLLRVQNSALEFK